MTAFKHWFVAIAAPAGMADAAAPLIGGSRIKIWADMGRTQEVTLPKTWNTVSAMPRTLYVEGVAPSAAMRDIELKLEYDENVDGESKDIFKCADKVKLTAVKISVEAIAFNYDLQSDANDALNLRKSYTEKIQIPEFVRGMRNEPIAYVRNRSPSILCKLTAQPTSIASAKISALSIDSDGALGNIVAKNVSFISGITKDGCDNPATDEFDESEYVQFSIQEKTPNKIRKTEDSWLWMATQINGIDVSALNLHIDKTLGHPVYVILDIPKPPWNQIAHNNQNPWCDALDFAISSCCTPNVNSPEDVLSNLAVSFFRVPYDPISHFVDDHVFLFTEYMSATFANCLDAALGLDTAASILGVDVQAVKRTYIFNFNFHCFTRYENTVYDCSSSMQTVLIGIPYSSYLNYANPQVGSTETPLNFELR